MRALTELANRGQSDPTPAGNTTHKESRNDKWSKESYSHSDSKGNPTLLHQVQQVSNEPGASNYAPGFNSLKTNVMVSPSSDENALVYGPDGQIILTEEESKFLHDNIDDEEYVKFQISIF